LGRKEGEIGFAVNFQLKASAKILISGKNFFFEAIFSIHLEKLKNFQRIFFSSTNCEQNYLLEINL